MATYQRITLAAFAALLAGLAVAPGWPVRAQDPAAPEPAAREPASKDAAATGDVVIDFEQVKILSDPTNDEVVNRAESYEEKGVVFQLAGQPRRSTARGRIMFFPHIADGHKGILNAMANEQEIPVRVTFPSGASAVTITFWASTGAAARLEAFNKDGDVVASDAVEVVPGRTAPDQPVPFFKLSVKAADIAYVQFSGPRTGEFLAADEVRFTPLRAAPAGSP